MPGTKNQVKRSKWKKQNLVLSSCSHIVCVFSPLHGVDFIFNVMISLIRDITLNGT